MTERLTEDDRLFIKRCAESILKELNKPSACGGYIGEKAEKIFLLCTGK